MKKVCAVYDIKAKLYSVPFYAHSRITAIRDFEAAVRSGAGNITTFPGDFELYLLGDWEEETAKFDVLPIPEFLCRGSQFQEDKQ